MMDLTSSNTSHSRVGRPSVNDDCNEVCSTASTQCDAACNLALMVGQLIVFLFPFTWSICLMVLTTNALSVSCNTIVVAPAAVVLLPYSYLLWQRMIMGRSSRSFQ